MKIENLFMEIFFKFFCCKWDYCLDPPRLPDERDPPELLALPPLLRDEPPELLTLLPLLLEDPPELL
jgi:hypothetical protein